MKYAIIIMDGAADDPLDELDGKTALEQANIEHTNWIARNGRQVRVKTVPDNLHPGSDVAQMSILGYNPATDYTGRAPLEAAAQNIKSTSSDWIFRCNLVTTADGIMIDNSAGHIDTTQAKLLIDELNLQLGNDVIKFYGGVSYRHLMVYKGGDFEMFIAPPHDIINQPINKYLPTGRQGKKLIRIMEQAAEILASHDVNKVRMDLSENPATDIWLWGQGKRPLLESFHHKYGIKAALITAVDLLRGIGKLTGIKVIEVDGATGYIDTNYTGKAQAAINALTDNDLIIVHVEAPDEASHAAMVDAKVESIENIDKYIVGPLLKHLRDTYEKWRIMVLPDHPTPIATRTHSRTPVPCAMAGNQVSGIVHKNFSEANCRQAGIYIENGHDLMEYFLKGQAT